ncbi:MAG: hypothetical protein ACREQ9_18760, partial [Candidatus Binatia bacterium]
ARTLFRRIWATYRDGARETEDQVIDHLTTAEVLMLDDISHEGRPSDAVISVLHEILTIRIGFGRPTVVTTNLLRSRRSDGTTARASGVASAAGRRW